MAAAQLIMRAKHRLCEAPTGLFFLSFVCTAIPATAAAAGTEQSVPVRAELSPEFGRQLQDEKRPNGGATCDLPTQTAAVHAACCDQASEDCSSGEPKTCNTGCAVVLVPFFDDCATALGDQAHAFDSVKQLCQDAIQSSDNEEPGAFCRVTGDDSCACELASSCPLPSLPPGCDCSGRWDGLNPGCDYSDCDRKCSCGDGNCCEVQPGDDRCSVDAMPGSFEWKLSYAVQRGCQIQALQVNGGREGSPRLDQSAALLCPNSVQEGSPPLVDTAGTTGSCAGDRAAEGLLCRNGEQEGTNVCSIRPLPCSMPLGAPRPIWACYVPQTPHMLGVDRIPPTGLGH